MYTSLLSYMFNMRARAHVCELNESSSVRQSIEIFIRKSINVIPDLTV